MATYSGKFFRSWELPPSTIPPFLEHKMNARIFFLLFLSFLFSFLWAEDYAFDNTITVDPSQPLSYTNAHDITTAISWAYSSYFVGNTLINVVVGEFPNLIACPEFSDNKVVKVVGTRISDTQMTTIASNNAGYLGLIGEENDLTGNVLIIENIRFEGASTGVKIEDINELEIYFNHCIFSNQVFWAIDSTVPFSVTNSKFLMPNSPSGYGQGAIRITGQDDYETSLVATISGNTFSGKFYDHIIHAGLGENIPCSHYLRAVHIENNLFDATLWYNNNFPTGNGAVQTGGVRDVKINGNIFHLNAYSNVTYPYQIRVYNPSWIYPPLSEVALQIMNNTLWYENNQNGYAGINVNKNFYTARIMNNVIGNMAGAGLDFYAYGDPLAGYSYKIQNNCIYNCNPAIANAGTSSGWTIDGQLYCDPQLDAAYQPMFNSAAVSPCVDSGNRDSDGDGIYWNGGGGFGVGSPDDADQDRSPLDIGAVTAIEHQFEDYPIPAAGAIKWMSYPVVNDLTEDHNRNYYFFRNIMYPSILDWVTYKVGNQQETSFLYNPNNGWINELDTVTSIVGYKVKLQPGVNTQIPLSNPGFLESPTTSISLYKYQAGTTVQNENWIGYFHQSSAHPLIAFSQVLDKILSIRTQYWSMAKNPKTGVWLIPAGNLTLNYGDMVIVTVNQDCSFTWNNAAPVDPKTRDKATAFEYEEKPDYVPMYVSMDNLNDLPDEIGIYVDDVCKGAVKVDSAYTDICVYLGENEALDPDNCELVLYYESKNGVSDRKTVKPGTDELNLISGNGLKCYTLKLSDGSQISELPPVSTLFQNYPNPFNPSTSIAYELAEDGMVSLDIYNIRGQQVRTLMNEHQLSGRHSIAWDGKDEHGNTVSSGIYYYRLNTKDASACKKMILMK